MLEMIKMIQEAEDFAALGAASKEKIADAEKELQLTFSADYKEYLSAFGAATFCGKELTGICASERLNVIAVTQKARNYYKGFPDDAYVVEEMLFDHFLVIQKTDGSVFSYGPNESEELIAESLSLYLFPQA
jgi:alpha-tubulin suppressor-like RCC1 family protein